MKIGAQRPGSAVAFCRKFLRKRAILSKPELRVEYSGVLCDSLFF